MLCIQKIEDIIRLFENSLSAISLMSITDLVKTIYRKKLIFVGLCNYTRSSGLDGIRLLNYQTFYYYLHIESPAVNTNQLKTNASIENLFLETRGDLGR
jgi:hypothetical protein